MIQQKYIRYKGKGEHSVRELEQIIEQREGELSEMRTENQALRQTAVKGLSIKEVRQAIADYMSSEGCSCCRNTNAHELNAARLGKLLKVKKYGDGSGYNFSKYKSKEK